MTDATASTTARFLFDSFVSAAEALVIVLEDARDTTEQYTFSGLTVKQIRTSGLVLTGQIDSVANKIERLEGVARLDA